MAYPTALKVIINIILFGLHSHLTDAAHNTRIVQHRMTVGHCSQEPDAGSSLCEEVVDSDGNWAVNLTTLSSMTLQTPQSGALM